MVEYDPPSCHPREGRFVNATSKDLKLWSQTSLLTIHRFRERLAPQARGYS